MFVLSSRRFPQMEEHLIADCNKEEITYVLFRVKFFTGIPDTHEDSLNDIFGSVIVTHKPSGKRQKKRKVSFKQLSESILIPFLYTFYYVSVVLFHLPSICTANIRKIPLNYLTALSYELVSLPVISKMRIWYPLLSASNSRRASSSLARIGKSFPHSPGLM